MNSTLMATPQAVAAAPIARAVPSFVRAPRAIAAASSMASFAALGCSWSHTTDEHANRIATEGLKAYGSRRLAETST
jgi:hypothetical protein